jgi:hypothetical protein
MKTENLIDKLFTLKNKEKEIKKEIDAIKNQIVEEFLPKIIKFKKLQLKGNNHIIELSMNNSYKIPRKPNEFTQTIKSITINKDDNPNNYSKIKPLLDSYDINYIETTKYKIKQDSYKSISNVNDFYKVNPTIYVKNVK